MTKHLELGRGLGVDTGGTHVRTALIEADNSLHALSRPDDQDQRYDMLEVPGNSGDYYDWLAGQADVAIGKGAEWLVTGVPCPVKPAPQGGQIISGAINEGAFYREEGEPGWHLQSELRNRGIDSEFPVIAANDLTLFTYAATRYARPEHRSILGVSLGTGLGTESVMRDNGVWHDSGLLMELGAYFKLELRGEKATYEQLLCKGGLAKILEVDPAEQLADSEYWIMYGEFLRHMVYTCRAAIGADLVVIGGGRGVATRHLYETSYENWRASEHDQRVIECNTFETVFVSPEEVDHFALYGAQAVAQSVLMDTR